jgi:hypothetical protein
VIKVKKNRNIIIVSFLIIASVFLWIGLNDTGIEQEKSQYYSKVKLSTLPNNLYQSMIAIEERAQEIKGSFNILNSLVNKKIKSTFPLILELQYTDGVIEKTIIDMPESFVGLTEKQLKSILNKWELKKYSTEDAIVLKRNVSEVSPEGKGFYHIGIKDNKVAIFYGKQGDLLKQVTDIRVDNLPLDEKTPLQQDGIVVKNKEELLSILEGLRSITDE